jgi:hypothetical protein
MPGERFSQEVRMLIAKNADKSNIDVRVFIFLSV